MTYDAAMIRREIETIRRRMHDWLQAAALDAETEADMKGEISDLEDMLYDLEPPRDKYAPTGGLNMDLFEKAFGTTPEKLGW